MPHPGEHPHARWGHLDQTVHGGSVNFFGDAGLDTVEQALAALVHRIGEAGGADVSEIHFEIRGPGEPRGTKAVRTLRFAECDRDFGLTETEMARLRAELSKSTLAPNIDVLVAFEKD